MTSASKACALVVAVCALAVVAAAQNATTWTAASVPVDVSGVYTGPQQLPGSRDHHTAVFVESTNKAYMYGGGGYGSNGVVGRLSDLWSFDGSTKRWEAIAGVQTVNAQSNYQGLAGTPGAREGHVMWAVTNGGETDIFLFGGNGLAGSSEVGLLSDLWRYRVSQGSWVFVMGHETVDNVGTYGTLGTPNADNRPGGREDCAVWVDGTTLWMFGGVGVDRQGNYGALNDLWSFNTVANMWTWHSGSDVAGHGGAVPASEGETGTPPARSSAAVWVTVEGSVYLFGGQYRSATGLNPDPNNPPNFHAFADMWKLDLETKAWTWAAGDNTYDYPGSMALPGARAGAATYTQGRKLWLYGGSGFVFGDAQPGRLSDMWAFSTETGTWSLEGGRTTTDDFATVGNTASGNTAPIEPGSTHEAAFWVAAGGVIYLHGGEGYGTTRLGKLASTWSFVLAPICGDFIKSDAEECDEPNDPNNVCSCSASCTYTQEGTVCEADEEVCSVDTCNGAGQCVLFQDNCGDGGAGMLMGGSASDEPLLTKEERQILAIAIAGGLLLILLVILLIYCCCCRRSSSKSAHPDKGSKGKKGKKGPSSGRNEFDESSSSSYSGMGHGKRAMKVDGSAYKPGGGHVVELDSVEHMNQPANVGAGGRAARSHDGSYVSYYSSDFTGLDSHTDSSL